MTYQAVIFDLDGTLLNTVEDIADSVNSVLKNRGYPGRGFEEYKLLVGAGLSELIKELIPHKAEDKEFIQDIKNEVRDVYKDRWCHKSHPYPGIPELLDQLAFHKIPMAVLSNKYHEGTSTIVNHFFKGRPLDPVMGARDGMPLKPDPTAALEISRQLEISPERFIYLGDTASDMQMAINAGMYPMGAKWGFRPEEELKQAGAKNIIETPQELLKYCEKKNS